MNSKKITQAAIVAGLYVVLVFVFQPISFGPIQFRIAETLAILPFLDPIFIPAIYIGVLLANILGGLGAWDILFGSLISLVAAFLTSKMPNKFLAPLPAIFVNSFGVSAYLAPLYGVPYFFSVIWIGIGEAVVLYALGLPLLKFFEQQLGKRKKRVKIRR